MAYGCSRARGRIIAATAGLHHSHSNTGSEPHLQHTPQLPGNDESLTHQARPGVEPSWIVVMFISIEPQRELTLCILKLKWVSSRQYKFGSCFFSLPATLWPLIKEFNPFTFRVITDMYEPTNAILLITFLLFIFLLLLFPSVSAYLYKLVIFSGDVILFPYLYVLWIYPRFLLCGYLEVYIRHLIANTIILNKSFTLVFLPLYLYFYVVPSFILCIQSQIIRAISIFNTVFL